MSNLRRFPFVRTGWPDHCWTSHLASEIGLFQRVFAKTPSPSCELFRIWLIWLDSLITSEILIMTGKVWPVNSDKWKAPLERCLFQRESKKRITVEVYVAPGVYFSEAGVSVMLLCRSSIIINHWPKSLSNAIIDCGKMLSGLLHDLKIFFG